MTVSTSRFRFGDFELDFDQRLLTRTGKEVQLTPKAMKLLLTLVANPGRVVEKNELIEAIWSDSFVEEGNLPYTVKLLRKSLEDNDRDHPVFIETVPRRGYRFIAPIKALEGSEERADPETLSGAPRWNSTAIRYALTALAVMAVWVVGFGSWYATNSQVGTPLWSGPLEVKRLSGDGKSAIAAVSPDGLFVAYVRGFGNEKESVRIRQLESGNDVELIPASDHFYFGLAFSPDSGSLYFARRPQDSVGQADIYRIPLRGGIPEIIVRKAQGWFSISPDGSLISFVRRRSGIDEDSSLYVASADGGANERLLVTRRSPSWIGANAFLSTSNTIAFVAGHSLSGELETQVFGVDLATGVERAITGTGFFSIKSLARLQSTGGLLMTASTDFAEPLRIWRIDLESGEAVPFTTDSGNYSGLTVNDAEDTIVSTQVWADRRMFRSTVVDPQPKELPAAGNSARFAPERIVFSSWMSGNYEIWVMDNDGGGQRQLTTDPKSDLDPVSSVDGKTIFFSSNRTGEQHVWRMNADGSDQSQLTRSEGGFPVSVSSDGEWIFYKHAKNGTLWRVNRSGGSEELVLGVRKDHVSVSPDGAYAVTVDENQDSRTFELVSLDSGKTIRNFKLPPSLRFISAIAWHPGGSMIGYIATDRAFGRKEFILQDLDGSKPVSVGNVGNENVWSLAFSTDGNEFLITKGIWKHDAVLINRAR